MPSPFIREAFERRAAVREEPGTHWLRVDAEFWAIVQHIEVEA